MNIIKEEGVSLRLSLEIEESGDVCKSGGSSIVATTRR